MSRIPGLSTCRNEDITERWTSQPERTHTRHIHLPQGSFPQSLARILPADLLVPAPAPAPAPVPVPELDHRGGGRGRVGQRAALVYIYTLPELPVLLDLGDFLSELSPRRVTSRATRLRYINGKSFSVPVRLSLVVVKGLSAALTLKSVALGCQLARQHLFATGVPILVTMPMDEKFFSLLEMGLSDMVSVHLSTIILHGGAPRDALDALFRFIEILCKSSLSVLELELELELATSHEDFVAVEKMVEALRHVATVGSLTLQVHRAIE